MRWRYHCWSFLICHCCVSCVFGRLVVGRACPCPPLLVGLLLCLVLCFVWCSPAAALPSGPPTLGVWWCWSVVLRAFPRLSPFGYLVALATVWASGRSAWPLVCCWLVWRWRFAFFPAFSYCMATKASALCGAPPSTPCCACVCGLWLPPLSRLHVAPRHHSLRRSAACVPLLGALCWSPCLSPSACPGRSSSVASVFCLSPRLVLCLLFFVALLLVVLSVRKVPLTFETSRPTWVSVQDVVLNKLRDRPRNQVNRSQSSATFTTTHKRRVSSCRYGSCWCVTPWHKTDAESPVSIFLPTSQKRSKTHVVTKSLYIKTWFVCLNKFECLKTVETFQAPKHVLWCLPQIF